MCLDTAMHMCVEIVELIEPLKPDDIRSIFPESILVSAFVTCAVSGLLLAFMTAVSGSRHKVVRSSR